MIKLMHITGASTNRIQEGKYSPIKIVIQPSPHFDTCFIKNSIPIRS